MQARDFRIGVDYLDLMSLYYLVAAIIQNVWREGKKYGGGDQ